MSSQRVYKKRERELRNREKQQKRIERRRFKRAWAAGEVFANLEDVFLISDDAIRGLQRSLQAGMNIVDRLKSLRSQRKTALS
jgi:hypothetical protein